MPKISEFYGIVEDYTIKVQFDDQKEFVFDIEPYLYGEVFEPLRKKSTFRQVKIDKELGTIVWPTGADFCPDFLYQKMEEKKSGTYNYNMNTPKEEVCLKEKRRKYERAKRKS